MKHHNAFHALITAVIFTCLYAFILINTPGPGLKESLIAHLNIPLLLYLAIVSWCIYLGSFFAVGIPLAVVSAFCDKDWTVEAADDIRICCIVVAIVIFLLTAFGFVSWGEFYG